MEEKKIVSTFLQILWRVCNARYVYDHNMNKKKKQKTKYPYVGCVIGEFCCVVNLAGGWQQQLWMLALLLVFFSSPVSLLKNKNIIHIPSFISSCLLFLLFRLLIYLIFRICFIFYYLYDFFLFALLFAYCQKSLSDPLCYQLLQT